MNLAKLTFKDEDIDFLILSTRTLTIDGKSRESFEPRDFGSSGLCLSDLKELESQSFEVIFLENIGGLSQGTVLELMHEALRVIVSTGMLVVFQTNQHEASALTSDILRSLSFNEDLRTEIMETNGETPLEQGNIVIMVRKNGRC